MKILLAADGSKFTKKALAFLATHEGLAGADAELIVLNVQSEVPPRVKRMLGSNNVKEYQLEEAQKVLNPIERYLKRQAFKFRTTWAVGSPSDEILRTAKREKAHMIVMGTHGLGLLGRALMGSVSQRVINDCDIPVLLVQ